MASILLLLSELLRRENLDILIMSSSFNHSTATKCSAEKSVNVIGQSCKNNALQDNQIQEDLPKWSELNPYCLGSPFLDFDIEKGDFLTNLVAASIHEQEHLMFPERALDFNSQLLNVDQLTRMLPSSSKYSYPLEMVPQKPFGNGGFVTNFPGSIAAQPIHHGESNLIQPKAEPSDSEFVGQCVTKGHCCCLELDSSTSSNSASSDPSPEFKNLF